MAEQGLLMVTNMEGSQITIPLKNSKKQRKVNFAFYKNLSFICLPTGGRDITTSLHVQQKMYHISPWNGKK